MESAVGSSWACTPVDVLCSILKRLVSACDLVRFGCVCKQWRLSAAVLSGHHGPKLDDDDDQQLHQIRHLPLLYVPTKTTGTLHRVNLDDTVTSGKFLHDVPPKLYNKPCIGSSHGWLFFVEKTLTLTMFNPFTGSTINLPPIDIDIEEEEKEIVEEEEVVNPIEYEIHKAVLLLKEGNCLSDNKFEFEVVAIYTHLARVAVYKSGYGRWTSSPGSASLDRMIFSDVSTYRGNIYASIWRSIITLNLIKEVEKLEEVYKLKWERVIRREVNQVGHMSYIVGSDAHHLLLVERYYYATDYQENPNPDDDDVAGYFKIDQDVHVYDSNYSRLTKCFKVYKIMENDKLVQVECLGDEAIFIGHNESIAVRATSGSGGGFKPNCIYYTDDFTGGLNGRYPYGPIDIGYFSLDDQYAKPLYTVLEAMQLQPDAPLPLWIEPIMHYF